MGSEKTVTSGIPIPNWVKSKLNDRYNLDDSAFSPPTDDDGFFFIPYPKPTDNANIDITSAVGEESKYISITRALNINSNNNTMAAGNNNNSAQFGFGQHTLPCQKYIGGMCDQTSANQKVNKSFGVDDGFKGEASLCGKSIVAVAEQMVRTNQLYNGRSSDDTFSGLPTEKYIRTRRNSRSLPSSPLTSRKKNPFFTPPILANAEVSKDDPFFVDRNIAKNKSRDVSPSTGGMRAKPTELREINFWSPTSM